jgi:hypothetical protein
MTAAEFRRMALLAALPLGAIVQPTGAQRPLPPDCMVALQLGVAPQ